MHWGLIPHWAADPSIGNRMINARAETLTDLPSFKPLVDRRRCIIPADGFYEWRKEGKRKVPMWVHLKSKEPFGLAGLWDVWRKPDGKRVESFTIITTEPNELVRPVHNRMPVILRPEDEEQWLDASRTSFAKARSLLKPYPEELMDAHDVSPMKAYGIVTTIGDNYAGAWPKEAFAVHGVSYEQCEQSKSDLYLAAIPLMSSKRVELPTNDRMVKEFRRLERKRGRGGKDAIQDGGRHDDLANAIVAAIHLASAGKTFNPRAVPTGVGRGIGADLRRAFGGSALRTSLRAFAGEDDEPPPKVSYRYRFWGE